MKKITLALGLLFFGMGAIVAQDLKKTKNIVMLAQLPGAGADKLEEARSEVDKLTTADKFKDNAEAWLLKMQVYGLMAGNEGLRAKYPTAGAEALAALNKYLQLEPAATKISEAGFVGLNDTYRSFFDEGVKNYNTKVWDKAFASFAKLSELGDLMIQRKWTNAAFDTTAYLFAGITAQNATLEDEAIKYYMPLADRKITGKDYEHIYVFLPNYYGTRRKDADFKKYLEISKELYPDKSRYWSDLEFEYNTSTLSVEDVAKQFDAADAANQLNSQQYFDYGNFFVSDKKVREMGEAEKLTYLKKSVQAFTKSAQTDSTNTLAFYNTGVTSYSLWEDALDQARKIKGTTADIKAKRAQADKQADAAADKSIEWLEKAYAKFDAKTNKEKLEVNSQTTTAKFLASLYEYKRERSKGNDKAYDNFDKKFKYFDTKY